MSAVALYYVHANWDRALPLGEQEGVHAHLRFLGGLIRAGVADEGGPFYGREEVVTGDLVGLLVFRGHDAAGVEEVLRGDPAVERGLMRVEVYPWYP